VAAADSSASPAAAASPGQAPTGSLYDLLQLPPEASASQLRQAFRQLSKRYHPDTTALPAQQASEAFRRLQQAYLTLSDPERRRAYDAALRALQVAPPASVRRTPEPVRRALSGGEWFALLLLALAVVFSLVLGVGLAWARGAAFLRAPSWWTVAGQTADSSLSSAADVGTAVPPGTAVQPSAAGPGVLADAAGGGSAGAERMPVGSTAAGLER
jgi:hypothetical protein